MATKYATNVLLAPGEVYDFDERVGPRTPERGFKLAKGITGPGVLEDVLGGGICQVSTTMFNAVAGGKAGLKINERWNHSIYISHYPKGRDATVTAGGKNLRFTNDTGHYIWITGESDGITTIISVWGTDQGRTTTWDIGEYYNVVPKGTTSSLDPLLKPGRTSLVRRAERQVPEDHPHRQGGRQGHPQGRLDQRVADVPGEDRRRPDDHEAPGLEHHVHLGLHDDHHHRRRRLGTVARAGRGLSPARTW